jgi:hypothetical protein
MVVAADTTQRVNLAASALLALSLDESVRANLETSGSYPLADPHLSELTLLLAPDWQLITGRRGTGKTHLAARCRELINSSEHRGLWSIAISAETLLVSPIGRDLSARQRARAALQVFLEQIGRELLRDLDRILPEYRIAKRRRRLLKDDVTRVLIQMIDAADEGYALTAVGTTTFEELLDLSSDVERSSELAGAAKLAKTGLGAELKVGTRRAKSSKESKALKQVAAYPAASLLSGIRSHLETVLSMLGLTRLYIFVDSVTSLGEIAQGVQPLFLNDLRRSLSGSDSLVVKLLANPYQLELLSGEAGSKGLHLGADVHHALDLDALIRADLYNSLTTILNRRLVISERLRPDIRELFSTPEAYRSFALSFGTNIVHMMSALRRLLRFNRPEVGHLWSQADVDQLVSNHVRQEVALLNTTTLTLLRSIIDSVESDGYASLSEPDARRCHTELLDLAERGLIEFDSDWPWLGPPQRVALPAGVRAALRSQYSDAAQGELSNPADTPVGSISAGDGASAESKSPAACDECGFVGTPHVGSTGRRVCAVCYATWVAEG